MKSSPRVSSNGNYLLARKEEGTATKNERDHHRPSSTSPSASSSTVAAARCAVEAYARLPARGKPNQGEHTVMASFVVKEEEESPLPLSSSSSSFSSPFPSSTFTAVAVATGSKCVGSGARSRRGDVVNDCHAEVLARRALLRWMVAEMEKAKAAAGSRFFERDTSSSSSSSSALPRFRKRTPWRLHLVTSQVPCGDACVRPGAITGARAMMMTTTRRGKEQGGEVEEGSAKNLLPTPPLEGFIDVNDQQPGIARRKPGRGDSTLSMSCSDKIAKWGCLGVQGSLLSRVLAAIGGEEQGEEGAIFIDEVTVVVVAEKDKNEQEEDAGRTVLSLQRAFADRMRPLRACLERPFRWSPPQRLSVVAVAWTKEEEEEVEAKKRGSSLPCSSSFPSFSSSSSSRNPLDDLGLDTSAGCTSSRAASAAAAEDDERGEGAKKEKLPCSARKTPSGLALAWSAVRERNGSGNFEKAEVLLGGYGCLAGVNRKKRAEEKKKRKKEEGSEAEEAGEEDDKERPHRPPLPQLSKRAAFARFLELVEEVGGSGSESSELASSTYREAKEGAAGYRRSWGRMLRFGGGGGGERGEEGERRKGESGRGEDAIGRGAGSSHPSSSALAEESTAKETEAAARCLPSPPPLQGWLTKPGELEAFTLLEFE